MRANGILDGRLHVRIFWIVSPVVIVDAVSHGDDLAASMGIRRWPMLGQIGEAKIRAGARASSSAQGKCSSRIAAARSAVKGAQGTTKHGTTVLHVGNRDFRIRWQRLNELRNVG